MAGNNKRLKKKMTEILKQENRPMSTEEIVIALSESRYPYTPSLRAASMLLRSKEFVNVGYHKVGGHDLTLWYLSEVLA